MSNSFSAQLLRNEIVRGLLGRCPCCGKGRMFGAFLKVKDHCDVCGEELYHLPADPDERCNRASDPSAEAGLREMRARLACWMERIDDPLPQFRGPRLNLRGQLG